MRAIFLLAAAAIFPISALAQNVQPGFDLANYGVRIDPDKRLMVVMAALELAETKNDAGIAVKLINTRLSVNGDKFRAQLLHDSAAVNEDLRGRISTFVAMYKKRYPQSTDAEIIAPFISMAYTLTPVPELADPVITNDLPGSLLDVLDFAPLVREFYRRSAISSKLNEYGKAYQTAADGVLRQTSRAMVSELLGYLHTRPQLFITERTKVQTQKTNGKASIEKVETRVRERHFFIVPEMLQPQGNISFLNAKDDYYVVVPPDKDVSFSEVRRAYLQFVVDPIVLSSSKEVASLRDWVKARLDERRKSDQDVSPDVLLAVSRSLAAAVDVRQAEYTKVRIATIQARRRIDGLKTDAENRAVGVELESYTRSLSDEAVLRLSEDYDKGLVLTFFFADKLREMEQSGFDIAASLPEMIASFDAVKETQRVAATTEARARALAARAVRKDHLETRVVPAEDPVTVRLREIEKNIDAKAYSKAGADLAQLSAQNPSEPRIYYDMGRVAALTAAGIDDPDTQTRKLIEASDAYKNVLRTATRKTDKALISLTYVALAKIYEHFNDNDYALRLYDEAIKLGNVAGGAYKDAFAAKQGLVKPQ